MPTDYPIKTWLIDLCLITLLMILLLSWFLGSIPLGVPDEARYAEIPREMIALHDYITPHLNNIKYFEKPVLFYWLQAGAIKLFGLSEGAIRLTNALFGLFGCLMVYSAGRLLFDRRTGWLASLILATSVLYFGMAHIVTLDMTFSVLLSTSLLSFLIASQASTGKRWFCYSGYIFAALATLTKGLAGIIFPGFIIFVWLLLLNQWRLLKVFNLPTGIIIFLIIALPWHILVQLQNPEFFHFYFIEQHFLRYLTHDAGRYQPIWFFIPVLIGGFLPWITLLPQALRHHWPRKDLKINQRQIYSFLLLWPALIFIFFSFSDSKLVTYLLPIFPALALLTGHYIADAWQTQSTTRGLKYGFIAMPVLIGLLGMGGIIAIKTIVFTLNAAQLLPYLIEVGVIWTGGAALGGSLICNKHFKQGFSCVAGSTALALIILLSQHNMINLGSIKPLAQKLKPYLTADTSIACYQNYYQDLPYYLERRIMIVDVRGELDFGMRHQNMRGWAMQPAQFWQQWQSGKRLFVVMQLNTFADLKRTTTYPFYSIAKTATDILLTNQPLPSAYNVP